MNGQFGGIGENLQRTTTAGGHSFTANGASSHAFKGFIEQLEKSGAPMDRVEGFNARKIAGSNRWSQHAYGNALDVDGSKYGVNTPFGQWARSHPNELGAALTRWNICLLYTSDAADE